MNHIKKLICRKRRGVVLIISMIFILIFSAFAVSMATLSGTNVQLADNQHKINTALCAAQSGLEVMRYWLSGITISGSVAAADRLETIAYDLPSNLTVDYDDTDPNNPTLTIPGITLDSQISQQFSAVITYGDDFETLQLDVTGANGQFYRRINTNFDFAPVGSDIFDFAIATKGPLQMDGNVDIDGLNEAIEASVYIESENDNIALEMVGKSAIAGNVSIANSLANVAISNASSVGGEIFTGVPTSEFPTPNPASFECYIQNTFDCNTDLSVPLENIRIPAGTNPTFSDVTIKGIMFIEAPNIVRFSGNTEITGIIVAAGSVDAPSLENKIEFSGNVNSYSVSNLPDEGFSEIKQETGTFLLAPGFSASFSGNFETLNGVIAASGIEFSGNVGGTINGSIVNYADTPMTFDGNTNLVFNRSGIEADPAGFGSSRILQFIPGSYSEPVL